MEALRTDYIDIYLLHEDDLERSVEEIVETMQFLREMASIKRIGVANMNYKRFCEAVCYAEKIIWNHFLFYKHGSHLQNIRGRCGMMKRLPIWKVRCINF